MKFVICIFLFSFLMSGCFTTNRMAKELNNTYNKNSNYLRTSLGPPNNIIDNGESGTVWIYSSQYSYSTNGWISNVGNTTYYNSPQTYTQEKVLKFWIDNNGTIFKYQTEGYLLKKPTALTWIFLGTVGVGICGLIAFVAS